MLNRHVIRAATRTALTLASLLFVATAWGQQAAPPQKVSLELLRALPAVYMVRTQSEGEVSFPKAIDIKLDGLDEEYAALKKEKQIPPELDLVSFKWLRVAVTPDKYFTPSRQKLSVSRKIRSTGSAFAIRGDGLLLTNRHVVEAFKSVPIDLRTSSSLEPPLLDKFFDELTPKLGGESKVKDVAQQAPMVLALWYGLQCRQTRLFKSAEILVSYRPQKDVPSAQQFALRKSLDLFGLDDREAVFVPVVVLNRGGPEWLNDVAVLQLNAIAKTDALVCLTLADDNAAKPDQAIDSFGFPGIHYNLKTMSALELLQVNIASGKVVRLGETMRKPTRQDAVLDSLSNDDPYGMAPLLQVTTKLWGGVSGGPIVNAEGKVIGLNVAGTPRALPPIFEPNIYSFVKDDGANEDYFAVPIASAKKILKETRAAAPLEGESTKLWREGLDLYQWEKYAEALTKFRDVAGRQKLGLPAVPGEVVVGRKPYEQVRTNEKNVVNQYVHLMLEMTEEKLKLSPSAGTR